MYFLKLLVLLIVVIFSTTTYAQSNGNPRPGSPHDTLIFHVKKAASGVVNCQPGGHASFVRYDHTNGSVVPVNIFITMTDWNQVDNDNDGLFDEDPDDGIDNDGDGDTDEDGQEPGAQTRFIDCDGLDGEITLQIQDTNPDAGYISTQEWFIRAIGKPEENFAFFTNADQVTCLLVEDPDGTPNTGDEVVDCSYDNSAWIPLGYVSTNGYDSDQDGTVDEVCVKQVKLGGKNNARGGGKTPFCDITPEFLVDVDIDDDGVADETNQFIFSISCLDVPETDVDESLTCPLSRIIWDIDEDETTSKAKAQVFVSHTGEAKIKGGKIKGRSK